MVRLWSHDKKTNLSEYQTNLIVTVVLVLRLLALSFLCYRVISVFIWVLALLPYVTLLVLLEPSVKINH